jgi:hypothetical protein
MIRSSIRAAAAFAALAMLAACAGGTSSLAPGGSPGAALPQSEIAQAPSILDGSSHVLIEDGVAVPGTHVMFAHRVIGAVPAPPAAGSIDELLYHGGKVMTFPAIGIVYWGFGATGDPDHEIPRLDAFLDHLRGSVPLKVVTQYYQVSGGGKQYIPDYPAMSVAVWHDDTDPLPSPGPKDKDVRAEALRAAARFNFVLPGVDNLIIVAIPHGVPMNYAACAYHGKVDGISYTNLPYQPDFGAGCGAYSVNNGPIGVLDGVTETAYHEIAESMTDPLLAAWYDVHGAEIGDKCQQYAANADFDGELFPAQPLWSNRHGDCAY